MQNKSAIINDIMNNLVNLRNIEEQNYNEIEARFCNLEKKNRIMIKYLKNMLEDLENNYAE